MPPTGRLRTASDHFRPLGGDAGDDPATARPASTDTSLAPPSPASALATRFGALDALRGLAAMVVVSAHALAAFLPYAVFGQNGLPRHVSAEWLFHLFPLSLLTAGHFAVCLFFVLSGYILSWRFIGRPEDWPDLVAAAAKRPLRLGGLVLLSIVLAALLWRAGLFYNLPTAEVTGSVEWLGTYWTRPFDAALFLQDLVRLKAGSEYNPPLWTIRIEYIGSFLVFGVLLLINRWSFRVRATVLAAGAVGLHGTFYQGFLLGILLADCQRQGILEHARRLVQGHLSLRALAWLGGVVAIVLASYPYYISKRIELPEPLGVVIQTGHWATAGATLVLLAFLVSPRLQRWVSHRWLQRLGDWSFAIYVLHFLVLGTLVCQAFLWLRSSAVGYLPAVALANAMGLLVLFPVAALATRWVDRPSIALANRLGAWLATDLRRRARQRMLPAWRTARREVAVPHILLVPGLAPGDQVSDVPAPEPARWDDAEPGAATRRPEDRPADRSRVPPSGSG